MELFNETGCAAGIVNTVISEDQLLAAVLCKATYRIDGQELTPEPDADPWPVGPSPVETEWGTLDGDMPFPRGGIDVMYLGSVHGPAGRPVEQLDVAISLGEDFRRTIRVYGDRLWVRANGRLVPSRPASFDTMPMTFARAYGGECEVETGWLKFPANPVGRGFYLEEWQAEGQPLANLEDPRRPVTEWSDQPDPLATGPYAFSWALRLGGAVEVGESEDGEQDISRLDPKLWNNAHPELIVARAIAPGEPLVVGHARKDGSDLEIRVPGDALHVHIQLERRHLLLPLALDQIVIFGDEERVLLVHRASFTYRVVPEERRAVTVHAGAVPAALPRSYPIDFDAFERWPQ